MLEIRGLTKSFRLRDGEVRALDGVDFDVAKGEFFVLLGPSGCGKTTMLRSIAGLERPDRGTIAIDGETVVSAGERRHVAPDRRPIAARSPWCSSRMPAGPEIRQDHGHQIAGTGRGARSSRAPGSRSRRS